MSPEKEPRVASFDVFDTLLTRAVGAPTSLFLLLGRTPAVAGITGLEAEAFARLRIDAERRARTGRREITVRDIYAELGVGLHLTAEQQRELVDEELALERRLSRAVPGALRLLKSEPAARRVALSDMYLPGEFVTELLDRQGLSEFLDRTLVSADHGVTKSDGGLYRSLLDTEAVAARNCRHTGDNALSDVRVARLLGMQAQHATAATLNRYEEIWEQHRWKTGGFSSLVAGASRLARLEAEATGDLVPLVDVAAGVAAPLLTAYVLWVLQSAQREGLQRLYFLARDGEVLHLIAQRLSERLGLGIELRYLYGSRSVYHRAALATKDLSAATWAWSAMYRLTSRDVLRRLGLSPAGAEAAIERLQLPTGPGSATPDVIERLVADAQLRADVRTAAGALLTRVQGYLRQEGLCDGTPYAIVDTGWAGRIAQALSDVFPSDAPPLRRGYLFGYMKRDDGYREPDVLRGYLFDEFAGTGFRGGFEQAYGPLETFAVANHGMTTDFVEKDGRFEPVLSSPTNPVLARWPWETFRATIARFVDELVLDADVAAVNADLRSGVADVLTAFWSHPTAEEARVWGSYVYEDDILAKSHNPLAKPIYPSDFWSKASRSYEGKRLWLAASVTLSPAAVRPAARAGLWFNERRREASGIGGFVPPRWRRRAQLVRQAAGTRRARA